jgi:hypothetical protein
MTCNCRSYNWEIGETPQVLLTPPEFWNSEKTQIPIDACIASVVQHLWDNKIVTLNSCCGHGREPRPAIILEQNMSPRRAERIRKLIKQVDDRDFKLMSWKLCEV